MPRHINPPLERPATAPYNFVPLPERVFEVGDGIKEGAETIRPWLEHRDRFLPGTHSGTITLNIETLTPLYVRGALHERQDGTWDGRAARLRPEPFTSPEGRPAIPGSSLRGMVRTLVEVLSFSKIRPVSNVRPFFRTVGTDRVGRAYRDRMTASGKGPLGGLIRIVNGSPHISPRDVVRVTRDTLTADTQLQLRGGPKYRPPWTHQHRRCWVQIAEGAFNVERLSLGEQPPDAAGWRAGTLVLTGNAPEKGREFVFLDRAGENADERTEIPEAVWTRFHDEDQITRWQEEAFPRRRPEGIDRGRDGALRDGEPVFYVFAEQLRSEANPEGLFLGRAGMFRLPYDTTPRDLVPAVLREAGLDLAEAMFGKVDKVGAIKGRVQFEDALAQDHEPGWFEPVVVPRVLSAPKPTAIAHYLTQNGRRPAAGLTTYLHGDVTTIRGHKLYWHRWQNGATIDAIKEQVGYAGFLADLQRAVPEDTQHTIIRPVKSGVHFVGRVRFSNLSTLELGALLHALELPAGCAHRLGMGKSLGLGSLRITPHLEITQPDVRYARWEGNGRVADDGSTAREEFVAAIRAHAQRTGELVLSAPTGLRGVARLDTLFCLLEWNNRPSLASTETMLLEGFRQKRVLPSPHGVLKIEEPTWPERIPTAGEVVSTPKPVPESRPASELRPPPRPVDKGQEREGVLERARGNEWVARFEGDEREARISNPSAVTEDCVAGARAEFFIEKQSKRDGIRCRVLRILAGPSPLKGLPPRS